MESPCDEILIPATESVVPIPDDELFFFFGVADETVWMKKMMGFRFGLS
jgi:hypothetical protein